MLPRSSEVHPGVAVILPMLAQASSSRHFLKAKVACNSTKIGTIMTMRHERGRQPKGARRPKNSLLWTVCGLQPRILLPGLLFLLVLQAHRGLSCGTEAASSLSSTSSFPHLGQEAG